MDASTLPTNTIFVDSDRIVISLPGDWEGFPPGQPFTTYLLDSAGRTTRTLGWTDDPTAFLLRPSTNTNLLPPTRTGTTFGTSVDPTNIFTWIPPTDGAFDPFPGASQSSAAPSASSSSTVSTSGTVTPFTTPLPTPRSTSAVLTSRQVTSPSLDLSTRVAIGVGSGVFGFILLLFALYFIGRHKRQKSKDSTTPPPNVREQNRRELTRTVERWGSSVSQPEVTESRALEGTGTLVGENLARINSQPRPGQMQRVESDPTGGQPLRRPDSPHPGVVALDPRIWNQGIVSPQPRPPSRPWRGFLDEAEYDAMRMTPGPLSVTEDYSTNAGEGSVDGYWLETASMREERLYRLQRPGHSPPPRSSSAQASSRASTSRARPEALVLAPQVPMSQIAEMSEVGMSPIRPEASTEQPGPEGQPQQSSSPGTADATGQPTSSGLGSNKPPPKPQDSPGQATSSGVGSSHPLLKPQESPGQATSSGVGSNQPLLKPQESSAQHSRNQSGDQSGEQSGGRSGDQSGEGQSPAAPEGGWI